MAKYWQESPPILQEFLNYHASIPVSYTHLDVYKRQDLLDSIEKMGVKICYVTLHVGLGTFRPVKAEEITDHAMHLSLIHI